jgi:outer membrane protein insertion porin family
VLRLRPARIVATALLLAGAGAASAVAAQRPEPEVRGLSFEGNRIFSDAVLRTAIVTAPTRCSQWVLEPACRLGLALDRRTLDERALQADSLRLRLFYYQRGYRAAEVGLHRVREEGGVRLRFSIREGAPVRVVSLDVRGDAALLAPVLARALPLRTAEPLDLTLYEAARDTLIERLRHRGHAHAEVLASYTISVAAPLEARVEFEALPGVRARFGTIEVVGAQRVSPAVVRRMLTFDEGALYRPVDVLRSQRNLFELDIFRHAEIHAEGFPGDTTIPVRVQVNEGNTHRVRIGGGMNTADCVNAEGRVVSRNFLGGARRLEARTRLSNLLAHQSGGGFPCFDAGRGIYADLSGLAAVDFTQPWFFSAANTFGGGVFAERRSLPEVFVRTSVGGRLSLGRSLSGGTSVAVGYRPELTQLAAEGGLFFCVNFVACETPEIRILEERHWLSPVTFSFARDRTNAFFAPTRGYVLRLDAERAAPWTGSEFAYTRLQAEATGYWEPARGVVLATRLRPGWAEGEDGEDATAGLGLHPQKRFFAGGANSIRGFAQYRLGPKLLVVDAAHRLARSDSAGLGAGCAPAQINDGSCDASRLADGFFEARPVGGPLSLEANAEVRFPLIGDRIRGAAFLDVGQVWGVDQPVRGGDLVWSPGFGVRYFSPAGPIRIDVGYNGSGGERLPVITTEVCGYRADGACVAIEEGTVFERLGNTTQLRRLNEPVLWNPRASFLDRLQLHLSIGQAF